MSNSIRLSGSFSPLNLEVERPDVNNDVVAFAIVNMKTNAIITGLEPFGLGDLDSSMFAILDVC